MSELVSVLIPAYNAEKWIKETIQSALDQTWPNKEIIIIDDGSSDNTFQISKKFESKSVKIIKQQNMGGPAARNKALSYSQGDYIQWLDHDDLLAPDKISQHLKKYNFGRDTRILLSSAFGTFYYCPQRAKFKPTSIWKDLTPIEYFFFRFTESAWFQPSAWLVSRKLTEMAGPWYEIRSPDDDGEYFCRIVAASEGIKFVEEARSYWRIGNLRSMSHCRSDDAIEALFKATYLCIKHLLSVEDSERTRAVSLKYLQRRFGYFYPERHEIINKVKDLAQDLGGSVLPPTKSRKFTLIRKIFGWKTATHIKNMLWRTKVLACRNWERLLYNLSI